MPGLLHMLALLMGLLLVTGVQAQERPKLAVLDFKQVKTGLEPHEVGLLTDLARTEAKQVVGAKYDIITKESLVDTQQSQLRWYRLDRTTGETTELVRFLPSREQALLFSFFDQYACSHPSLAPDGNTLAFAGHLLETAESDPSAPPHIYTLPLKPTSTPQPIAPGTLACWDVPSRPSSEEMERKECGL